MTTASASNVPSLAGTPAAAPLGYMSWTAGQLARDPYYIMVVIYIFFPYFSNHVVGDPVRGQSLLGYLNATVGVILALTAPFLGAIADKHGRRKPWIAVNVALVGIGACMLWWALPGGEGISVPLLVALLIAVKCAFSISDVFHNAMLPGIAPVNRVGMISGTAFALGNVGGLLCMLFVLYAFALPGNVDWPGVPDSPLWGIDQSSHEHDRIVGPIAGIWILIFTLPVLLLTPDGPKPTMTLVAAAREGVQDVIETFRQLRHYSNIALYLFSRMLFIDGMVGVMTFGGVYASGTFGWGSITLLLFGLCSSASAMLGAWAGGLLDDRLGSLNALRVSIAVSCLLLISLVSVTPDTVLFFITVSTEPVWDFPYFNTTAEIYYFVNNQFFAMFFVTGLSTSRTLMARISPPEMATQFFGLFALSGMVTAFLAPLMVATTTAWFESQRAGFASLAALMIIGGILLAWVKQEQGTKAPPRTSV